MPSTSRVRRGGEVALPLVAFTGGAGPDRVTTVSGHYKTGEIGSTKYHYFHKDTDPVLATS
ncbi:hypothetical protein ABZ366_25540, partial [Streptomyces sp. NPDC005904]|uniref:hypothetical protein n=1 Tax=Streptomyces sp. NPDC005904 TaxID=3154570 RepID=UPI0033D29D74